MCRNGTPSLLGFSFLGNKVKKRKTGQKGKEPLEIYALIKIKSRRNSSWIRRVYFFGGIVCVKITALINSLKATNYYDDALSALQD